MTFYRLNFLARIEATDSKFSLKSFDAVIIVQLEKPENNNYNELIAEYNNQVRKDQPNRHMFLIPHAYINGRKACLVAISMGDGNFEIDFFKGLTPLSLTYAYLRGETITKIKGPHILQKLNLINYIECGSERDRNSYAVYTGKI